MLLRECANERMTDQKEFVEDWNISKILNKLKVNSIEEGIKNCIDEIKSHHYALNLDWQGKTRLYYQLENNNLLLTLTKDDNRNSKDRYYYSFKNEEEKLKILFYITTDMTQLEKFEF